MQLTKSLAMEWAEHNIRVNSISPGYTATPMNLRPEVANQVRTFERDTPLGRMAEVDEMVGPAVFLLSDAASFCTGADLRCSEQGTTIDWIDTADQAEEHSLRSIANVAADTLSEPTPSLRRTAWTESCRHARTIGEELAATGQPGWQPPGNLTAWVSVGGRRRYGRRRT